jgi:hypothetical protein
MPETIEVVPDRIDQQRLAQQLVEAARAEGVKLVGPGGLLIGLTKTVLETALEAEMTEHLGYDRHDRVGCDGVNSRDGTRTKTVLTEIGPVRIEVPRDRDASFDPVIVRKRQRRLDGIDEIVLSLTARGLTPGEVAAHFDEALRREGEPGHDLPDHRQGRRGDEPVAGPATGCGLIPIGGCERLGGRRRASIRAEQDADRGEEALLRADPVRDEGSGRSPGGGRVDQLWVVVVPRRWRRDHQRASAHLCAVPD